MQRDDWSDRTLATRVAQTGIGVLALLGVVHTGPAHAGGVILAAAVLIAAVGAVGAGLGRLP